MRSDGIAGGCQCGAVRYVLTRKPYKVYACHCLECQKQSAAAFGLSLPVKLEDMEIEGETADYVRPADSGARTRCTFCLNCGTRLHHISDRSPECVVIKAGTLDETRNLEPVAHLWVCRRQAWVILDDDVPAHSTQPADFKAWREELIG